MTLRQGVKGPQAGMQSNRKVACLRLWEMLLSVMHPSDLVESETKRLGKHSFNLQFAVCWGAQPSFEQQLSVILGALILDTLFLVSRVCLV